MHAFWEEVAVFKGYRTNFVKSCSAANQNFTCSHHQLCLFGLVVHPWDASKPCTRFLALPWTVVALAILGLVLTYLLRGWRVCREFKQFPKMRFGAALQVVLWHNASVNVMPFRSGEAAFPWLLNRRFDISLTRATASLLWLRIQDACVVLMLGVWVLADIELLLRVVLSFGLVVAALLFAKWSRAASPTPFTQWPWKYLNGFRQAWLNPMRTHLKVGGSHWPIG